MIGPTVQSFGVTFFADGFSGVLFSIKALTLPRPRYAPSRRNADYSQNHTVTFLFLWQQTDCRLSPSGSPAGVGRFFFGAPSRSSRTFTHE